jgi:hypothetical protein
VNDLRSRGSRVPHRAKRHARRISNGFDMRRLRELLANIGAHGPGIRVGPSLQIGNDRLKAIADRAVGDVPPHVSDVGL